MEKSLLEKELTLNELLELMEKFGFEHEEKLNEDDKHEFTLKNRSVYIYKDELILGRIIQIIHFIIENDAYERGWKAMENTIIKPPVQDTDETSTVEGTTLVKTFLERKLTLEELKELMGIYQCKYIEDTPTGYKFIYYHTRFYINKNEMWLRKAIDIATDVIAETSFKAGRTQESRNPSPQTDTELPQTIKHVNEYGVIVTEREAKRTVERFDESERSRDTDQSAVSEQSINHPSYYGGADNPYEAIKVIEAWQLGFALGNAVKYISRAGKKSTGTIQDLQKAIWYIQREIANLTK